MPELFTPPFRLNSSTEIVPRSTGITQITGNAGGLTIRGGTGSGDTLTLQSTTNATKGKILFGLSAYDEVNNRLGIKTASPVAELEVRHAAFTPDSVLFGGATVLTTDAQAADVGGQICLGGKYNSSGAFANFASIVGRKVNSTDGSLIGYLAFFVGSGFLGIQGEAMRILGTPSFGSPIPIILMHTAASSSASASPEIGGTTTALLLSRLTTAQRNALTAVDGMLLHDSTIGRFTHRSSGSWLKTVGTINADTTTVSVSNTTTETSIGSFSLPGGTLDLASKFRAVYYGTILKNVATSFTIRVKYGATTLITASGITLVSSAVNYAFKLEVDLSGGNATGSQKCLLRFFAERPGDLGSINEFDYATSAEDSTVAKTFDVTIQWAAASVLLNFSKEVLHMEVV